MSSESKALAWVANLSHQFNNFCSEADAIIPQEQIAYIRNQFVTAGESLRQFYSELLEDALSVGCLDARSGPTSPRKKEEMTILPSCEMSLLPTEPAAGVVCEDYSSKVAVAKNPEIKISEPSLNSVQCSLVIEYPEEICKFEEDHFAPNADEYNLQNNKVSRVTSTASACSMEAIQTCVSDLPEHIHTGESKEPANIDDVSYQKPDNIDKKFTKNMRKIASLDFDDEEVETTGWEKLDEDLLCDSDWEFI